MRADSDFVWPAKARTTGRQLVRRLRKLLRGRVEQAYLFGSFSRGEASADSDVDLILVRKTTLPWPERGKPFADLQRALGAVDLLVYTPAEWRTMCGAPTGFLDQIRREWLPVISEPTDKRNSLR
ncbi:MAG: nucleotidyltransferase domain-containing protein [Deltaproteobacteria bacterium]|nr:nucleotidyltransferase domain-containing protein [Deltaproteobacteria bacterium]